MKKTDSPRRSYSAGVGFRELPQLWKRDWKRAYSILTRDHAEEEEPKGFFRRWWYRTKTLFLELSYKLSPPRRLLFAICLVLAVIGLDSDSVEPDPGDSVTVMNHPVLLLASVVGLVFLLILELADRIVVRDELEVARQLQTDLMPHEPPQVTGYDFSFSYRSANTIGGDYYDFVPLDDGRLAIAIGDASGHGIAAGLLMAIAHATMRLAVATDPAPLPVAGMFHRALLETGGARAFLTLFYGLLEPQSGHLDYVCAGHPFPLLRRNSGEIVRLGQGAFPLGLRKELSLEQAATELGPGDVLMLYTDGIPEALGATGEAFGYPRLETILAPGGTAAGIHGRTIAELGRFEGDRAPHDDRSLVVVERISGAREENA